METLKNYYEVFINWGGTLFCVITIDRDYHKRAAQLSMPRYIEKALHKLQHSKPTKKQNAPYKHTYIQYGKNPNCGNGSIGAIITNINKICAKFHGNTFVLFKKSRPNIGSGIE